MTLRNWYEKLAPLSDAHPVDQEAERRLRGMSEYRELRARVFELGGMLTHRLVGDTKKAWLQLEAAINDRWARFAEMCFNLGVEHGQAQRVVDDILGDAGVAEARISPLVAIRALAAAMARIADRLD